MNFRISTLLLFVSLGCLLIAWRADRLGWQDRLEGQAQANELERQANDTYIRLEEFTRRPQTLGDNVDQFGINNTNDLLIIVQILEVYRQKNELGEPYRSRMPAIVGSALARLNCHTADDFLSFANSRLPTKAVDFAGYDSDVTACLVSSHPDHSEFKAFLDGLPKTQYFPKPIGPLQITGLHLKPFAPKSRRTPQICPDDVPAHQPIEF